MRLGVAAGSCSLMMRAGGGYHQLVHRRTADSGGAPGCAFLRNRLTPGNTGCVQDSPNMPVLQRRINETFEGEPS